ncbi:peptidylprolyl isomerase [Dongia deserti]|uniref:peptidylprolyl isomerase n=1 Tax=Dongia deserti TaxID=2268030 RepID=UPI000E652C6F|nr:peptidylprolyl isomerase [Dongia deserti]
MLTSIRGKAKSWIFKILFGILIIAFAAWGIGDIFARRDLSKPVLQVGDLAYTQQEFDRDLRRRLQQFRQQGLDINVQQFAALGGVDQILSQQTSQMLLRQYADRLGLTIPQAVAIGDIQNNPAFRNAAGQFDRDRFLALLSQSGLSEAGYVQMRRDEMRLQQLTGPAFGALSTPPVLSDRVFAYLNEERTAEFLVIPDATMEVKEPDQAAMEKFYQDNIARYQRPEYRAFIAVHMKPEDFAKDITIPEDQLKSEFESRQAEFSTPESRAVEQVVLQDQAKADAIVAAVKGGKSFADAVKEVTGSAPVDLGDVTKDKLPPAIAEQSFALPADGVSEPLKSAFGLHVVHVKSITPGVTKTFEDVKEQLRQELALAQAGDAMVSVVNQLDDTLAGGASLEQAAQQLNLTTQKYEAVDSSGKDRDGKDANVIPEILQLAEQTEAGQTSLVSTLSDGSYAVVQVTNVMPAEAKPLNEVAEQVKQDWLAKARRDAADAKAKEIADKVKSGDLAALGKELGLELKVSKPFTRSEGDGPIDQSLAQKLFELQLGEAATGRTGDGAIVARVSAIIPAKPEEKKDQVAQLSEQLADTMRKDLYAEFLFALGQNIEVERNNDVVQQMISAEQ